MNDNPFLSTFKIAATVTIFAIIGILGFLIYPNLFKNNLDYDVFKYIFQFLLLVVVGGAVTLVFTNYTKSKEERIKQNEKQETKKNEKKIEQHKFHNDFLLSYNSIKLIRRMFRARARVLCKNDNGEESTFIKTKIYDELMQELTKTQLQFEFYIDEAESNPNLFDEKNKKLETEIRSMEDYLNKIVAEYEGCYKNFLNKYYVDDIPTISLYKLPMLAEFIIKYDDAINFKKNFKTPANNIQQIILKIIKTKN